MGGGREKARRGPKSTNTEDRDEVMIFRTLTLLTEQLWREYNTRERSHQGNYLTNRPKLVTVR